MNSRINELFNELKSLKTIRNQQDFVERIGSDKATISNILRGKLPPTNKVLAGIEMAFPDVNMVWLRTGEGNMFTEAASTQQNDDDITIVPLLPIAAQAGSLSYFTQSVQFSDCEMIISPIKGADYAMRVSGESMSPEYPNGSQVLIKKVDPNMFMDWGRVYVLDTYNGTVMKQLAPGSQPDRIKCISKNPDPIYAPFEVLWDDVIGVYRVLMCMSVK